MPKIFIEKKFESNEEMIAQIENIEVIEKLEKLLKNIFCAGNLLNDMIYNI